MGGDYYDRDVGTATTSTSDQVLSQTQIHSSCNPTRWAEEKLECSARHPIVFALDVTGSMGDWTKIIYDKMPMFYGQIKMQNYLEDPSISFCAIGDHSGDLAPLQCTEFGQGNEIDQLISKIFLEGNGQGNGIEGYEMSAYFYDNRVELNGCEIPFLFITGDEGFYKTVDDNIIVRLCGISSGNKSIEGEDILKSAMKKFNLFHVKKEYNDSIRQQWNKAIGEERVLDISTPKACIDIILGAIALTTGKRTLDQYVKDLIDRGQSKERVEEVTKSLSKYWKKLQWGEIKPIIHAKALNLDEVKQLALKTRESKYGDKAIKFDEVQKKLHDQVPKEYLCPITGKLMIEPTITSDGETYEKEAIELFFNQGKRVNPLTGEKLDSTSMSNKSVMKMIEDFVNKNH